MYRRKARSRPEDWSRALANDITAEPRRPEVVRTLSNVAGWPRAIQLCWNGVGVLTGVDTNTGVAEDMADRQGNLSATDVSGVFSKQCGPLPEDRIPKTQEDLLNLADSYFGYLVRRLPLIRVRRSSGIELLAGPVRLLAFELDRVDIEPTPAVRFRITGGMLDALSASQGSLSLTVELDNGRARLCVVVADYQPRLAGPVGGPLYRWIQTPLHRRLGYGFVRWAANRPQLERHP